jgi:hypothetical protein
MGQLSYLQTVGKKVQALYADAVGVWIKAIGKASDGTLDPKEFLNDLIANSAKGVEALISLLTDGGSPLMPTVSINETADTVKNKGTSSTAYLDTPAEKPLITCTNPLILLGQTAPSNPVQAAVAFTSAWREEIKVTVRAKDTKAGDPKPTAGIYVGGVFDAGGTLVANIAVNVR